MAFIVPNSGNNNLPVVGPSFSTRSSGSTTSSGNFFDSFSISSNGLSIRPGSGSSLFNPTINLSIGGGGRSGSRSTSARKGSNGSSDSGSDANGNSNSGGGGRGGRPNKRSRKPSSSRAFYPHVDRGVTNVAFSSGIQSGTIVNPQEGGSDNFTPLLILNGEFFPLDKTNSNSLLSDVLGKDIYFSYLTMAQEKVNYKVGSQFAQDDFIDYIYSLSAALQLYYMVESILTYCNNPANSNRGMTHLRSLIDADILSEHSRLGTYLLKMPIPSNLLDYIRYMYQNFTFGDHPNSPVIRLGFRGALYTCNSISNGKLSGEIYDDIIDTLFSHNRVVSVITKSFPEQLIREMPPCFDGAMFDRQFMTFWHNSNIAYSDHERNLVNSNECQNHSAQIEYGSFVDDIDGVIYASSSTVVSGISQPGIWKSFSGFESDWDYDDMTSLTVFKNNNIVGASSINHRLQSAVRNCPYYNGGSWISLNGYVPGSARVQVHSIENTKQAVALSVRLLVEPV